MNDDMCLKCRNLKGFPNCLPTVKSSDPFLNFSPLFSLLPAFTEHFKCLSILIGLKGVDYKVYFIKRQVI